MKILLFLLLVLVVGCGSDSNDELPVVSISSNGVMTSINKWGVEFKRSTPIEQTSDLEQLAGKAVANINSNVGWNATGFFISEYGLFMTNHHVLNRDNGCSEKKCQGFQIIRNLSPNGDIQFFREMKLLVADKTLDYAILKVNTNGEKVPYIKLATDFDNDKLHLKIIGHPHSGALRSSSAEISWSSDENYSLELNSVAISGNSGSPLIDLNSGKAIALYNSSSWSKSSITMDGSIKHSGRATKLSDIERNISERYTGISFSNLNMIPELDRYKRAARKTVDKHRTTVFSYYGHDLSYFVDVLRDLVRDYKDANLSIEKTNVKREIIKLVKSANHFRGRTNTELVVSEKLLKKLDTIFNLSELSYKDKYYQFRHYRSRKCSSDVKAKYENYSVDRAYDYIARCFLGHTIVREDFWNYNLNHLIEYYETQKTKSAASFLAWGFEKGTYSFSDLNLELMSQQDWQSITSALDDTMRNESNHADYMTLEFSKVFSLNPDKLSELRNFGEMK